MTTVLLVIVALAYFLRRRSGDTREGLPELLAGAERAGIITAVQREQILARAAVQGETKARRGGAAWLGIMAGLFVVAGVSLLIARNWEAIGPVVRIGAFLALLAAVGEGAIRTRERALGVSLLLEIFWLFLPLLGIGLYGQTFQLSGDPIRPFLVWLALTAPLAWLTTRPTVAILHTFALVAVLFSGNFLIEPATMLLGEGRSAGGMLAIGSEHASGSAWGLSLIMLAAIGAQSLRRLPRSHRHHFVGVFVFWILAILVAPTPVRLQHPGWLLVGTVALSTLWVVILTAMETSLEERAPAVMVWLAGLYAQTFTWHLHSPAEGATTAGGLAIVGIVALATVGGTLTLPSARVSPFPAWAAAVKAVLLVPLAVSLLYLGSDMQLIWMAAGAMNVVMLVIAVGLMWHGSLVHEPPQVNLGVLILVGMLITRFLDVFGSMLRSGIGFIVAGVLLAALSWALERTRRRLIALPREVAP